MFGYKACIISGNVDHGKPTNQTSKQKRKQQEEKEKQIIFFK